MLLTTIETIPGKRIVEVHGLVASSTVRAKDVFKDIGASLKSVFGGRLESYTKLMTESREEVLSDLVHQATGLGANAVICIRATTSQIMAGAAEIYVYGTAVTLKDEL